MGVACRSRCVSFSWQFSPTLNFSLPALTTRIGCAPKGWLVGNNKLHRRNRRQDDREVVATTAAQSGGLSWRLLSTLTGTTVTLDETVGLQNDDTNAALPSAFGLASQSLEHDADLVLGRLVLARRRRIP